MAVGGAKPKPSAQKQLEGNPGKRPQNKNEPQPRPGVPPCPRTLDAEARKEWKWAAKEIPPGVLTQADKSMLELYCQLRAEVRVRIMVGLPINSAMIAQVRALANEFGLTPSARVRLSVEPPKEKDPFDDILKRNSQN